MVGKREQEIINAYEGWDPDEETVNSLVERLSISRQRLYSVLDRQGVVPKSRRRRSRGNTDHDLTEEMAEMALGYLLTQLQQCREELARYREANPDEPEPGGPARR